jgi:hypothetical protein
VGPQLEKHTHPRGSCCSHLYRTDRPFMSSPHQLSYSYCGFLVEHLRWTRTNHCFAFPRGIIHTLSLRRSRSRRPPYLIRHHHQRRQYNLSNPSKKGISIVFALSCGSAELPVSSSLSSQTRGPSVEVAAPWLADPRCLFGALSEVLGGSPTDGMAPVVPPHSTPG